MHYAATQGHIDIIRLLFDTEANLDAKDIHQMTPLHEACNYGHLNIVRFLLSMRETAEIDLDCETSTKKMTPLHYAGMYISLEYQLISRKKDQGNSFLMQLQHKKDIQILYPIC